MGERELIVSEVPLQTASDLLREALEGFESPRLAVSGGSAAAVLGLARIDLGHRWKRVRLTWVDERRVPALDPHSNRGEAYRLGYLDAGDAPAVELPLFLDGETPAQACLRVEEGLDSLFEGGLDVLLLGLGEDGHSASLFPGAPWPDLRVHAVDASPKPPAQRITLGLGLLADTPLAILVALGVTKAPALERLLRGDRALPASALGELIVVTDQSLIGAPHGRT